MTAEPVSPVEVRRQIWESLVSMLRVYTHAAGLSRQGYGVASDAESASVTYADSVLRVSYAPHTGAAVWRLESSELVVEGRFDIDDHGRLIFPDGARELDEAAIDWVQQLGQHEFQT